MSRITCKNKGFTLAEVLIALGVIGVVAAVALPSVITNIQEKQRAEQIRTVKYKFTKATDKMNSLGLMVQYPSTKDFVTELSKHLKLAKICESDNLTDCWPYEQITLSDGTKFNVNSITNGTSFKKTKGDWTSPAIGIITADGTPMILSYRKDCEPLDSVKQYPWSTVDGKPVTNDTAKCVSSIFELNGKAGKNQFKKDVIAFNANGIGNDCAVGVAANNKCFSEPFQPSVPFTYAQCMAKKDELGISLCYSGSNTNYWTAAVNECGGINNMPSSSDLDALGKLLYKNKQYDMNSPTAKALGLTPNFSIWTKHEADAHRVGATCYKSGSYAYGFGASRISLVTSNCEANYYTICIAE